MGTRSLIVIYYNGKYVLAQYVQWNGYPDGQGAQILKFLSTPGKTTALKSNLHLLCVATPEQLEAIDEECEQAERKERGFLGILGTFFNRHYPSLSRETGAKILDLIADAEDDKPILIKDSLKLAVDFVWCEWKYVIDLDANKLEVYSGKVAVSDAEAARSRFAFLLQPGGQEEREMLVNTIPDMMAEFDIEKLPGEDEFVSQIARRFRERHFGKDGVNGGQGNCE